LSTDQMGDFLRFALHDAGTDRAMACGMSVYSQRELVQGDLDGYYADPGVINFYLPNTLLDSIGLFTWSREGRKQASIEIYSEQYGAPLFFHEGAARLRLLLPAFQGSVAMMQAADAVKAGLALLLDRLEQPLALADDRGRLTHRTGALNDLIASDPDRVQLTSALERIAKTHASLFAARGVGRQHRVGGTAIALGENVMTPIRTSTRGYRVFLVEAPEALTAGRLGFLLRLEALTDTVFTAAELQLRFGLSAREIQVARLLATGLSNGDVARALAISAHTARRHTEKVFTKLNTTSRSAVGPAMMGPAGTA
jgi:DNA-binding CsgD family transcriptional regulator